MRNLGCLIICLVASLAAAEPVTYCQHVAPILFQNCVVCHRPGEIGPFSLLNYSDASKRAEQLAAVVSARLMPVWKPVPGHGEFQDERRLSEQQIATIRAWAETGAPEGDRQQLPPRPRFKAGWQLGKPDIVLKMPEKFTIPAEGNDVYIHFVFPLPMEKEIHIRAVECRPSNKRVAHHAVGILDSSGTARKLDAEQPGLGYVNFGGPGFIPAGFTPGFVPGQTPRFFADGAAITVRKGTDFVLQMHYHSSGREETDQTEVGLYLSETPPTKHILGVLLGSEAIDIPASSDTFKVHDSFVLPVEMKADAIWAHMHMIGKEARVWAELPDGSTEKLLKIDDWDFNWQDTYLYRKPVVLPKGTVLRAEWRYDNTAANPRNPFQPPRRITLGEQSTDEMAGIWLGGEVASSGDLWTLLAANLGHYLQIKSKPVKP